MNTTFDDSKGHANNTLELLTISTNIIISILTLGLNIYQTRTMKREHKFTCKSGCSSCLYHSSPSESSSGV